MKHNIEQFVHYSLFFAIFGALFWVANRVTIAWFWITSAGSIVAIIGAMIAFPGNIPRHILTGLIFFELLLMFQFWTLRSRNRAAIAVLVFWFLAQSFRTTTMSSFGRRLLIFGLIFILLYGMVVFTLPQEIQF